MNRQWVPLVVVLGLVVFASPAGSVQSEGNASNDTDLGTNISSFMQASTVEAESEVDRGMFDAALANAPNDTVRHRLLERRARGLQTRVAAVERNVEAASRADERRGAVDRTVANARVGSLERSLAALVAAASREGVSPNGLDSLREDVRELNRPSVPPALDAEDGPAATPPAPGDDAAPGTGEGVDGLGADGDGERPDAGGPDATGRQDAPGGDGGAPTANGVENPGAPGQGDDPTPNDASSQDDAPGQGDAPGQDDAPRPSDATPAPNGDVAPAGPDGGSDGSGPADASNGTNATPEGSESDGGPPPEG